MHEEEVEVEGRAEENREDWLSSCFINIEEVLQPLQGGRSARGFATGKEMYAQTGCLQGQAEEGRKQTHCEQGVHAHAGIKYYILRHGSLHLPFTSLRSGGLKADSPHPASHPWKAPVLHFLMYLKAHRQKQERKLSLDAGRKGAPQGNSLRNTVSNGKFDCISLGLYDLL